MQRMNKWNSTSYEIFDMMEDVSTLNPNLDTIWMWKKNTHQNSERVSLFYYLRVVTRTSDIKIGYF